MIEFEIKILSIAVIPIFWVIPALINGAAADLDGTAPSGSNFVLDNLDCDGAESSILHCPETGEVTEICEASQIAGVKCAKSKIWLLFTYVTNPFWLDYFNYLRVQYFEI